MHDIVMGYEWDPSFPCEPYRPMSTSTNVAISTMNNNDIDPTNSIEENGNDNDPETELCSSLLEKPEPITNPLENGSSGIDNAPLLKSDSTNGIKRRNTRLEEEQVSLLNADQPQPVEN